MMGFSTVQVEIFSKENLPICGLPAVAVGCSGQFRPIYGAVRVFFGRKMIAEQKLFIFAGEYSS